MKMVTIVKQRYFGVTNNALSIFSESSLSFAQMYTFDILSCISFTR